jgi:integrase
VRYSGVLAAASPWRPRIAPKPPAQVPTAETAEPDRTGPAGGYRPWAELLARTFAVDVLSCPSHATHILEGGADVRQIQEPLGHKRIATTALYTKVDLRGLHAMIGRCHPRERGSR